MAKTKRKKKTGRHVHILIPVIALLFCAVVLVTTLFFRSLETPAEPTPQAQAGPSPSPVPTPSPTPAPPTPTPAPTPYVPPQLTLDVICEEETLDVVVCDSEGLAFPGYAFPLTISFESGEGHDVVTDVNGHYAASYLVGGEYTVSMPEVEGFLSPQSVSCQVKERPSYNRYLTVANLLAANGLSSLPPQEGDSILYTYETGPNGFLLLADGTESDVRPVEEEGQLVRGERSVLHYFSSDGTPTEPEDLPEDALAGTDYYTEETVEQVELLLPDGTPDEAYRITAEIDTSARPDHGWIELNGKTYYSNAEGQLVTGLKNIGGRLSYFDPEGVRASKLGIDVSYFNAAIDWNAVKAGGIDFAIVRVVGRTWEKGILFEDEDSYRRGTNGGFYLQGAKAAGLEVGAYVYSNAINEKEAVEEAELAIEVLKKADVELDMPIYYDLEFSGEYPRGRADRLSMIQRAAIVKAFCTKIEQAGYRAGVYAGEYFFTRALRLQDVEPYDLWYAVYTEDLVPPDFRGFDIWQFSESTRIDGMPDETDMNVIF